jgi:hypothetical protein
MVVTPQRGKTVMAAANATITENGGSVALRFSRSDSLFDLGLQISKLKLAPACIGGYSIKLGILWAMIWPGHG